jgi:hypothetical protein
MMKAQNSGKCVQLNDQGVVVQFTCDSSNQKQLFTPKLRSAVTAIPSTTNYNIVNKASSNCIRSRGVSINVYHDRCDKTALSLWQFNKEQDGAYVIKNVSFGEVFNIYSAYQTDGTALWSYIQHDQSNERFFPEFISTTEFLIRAKNSLKCIQTNGETLAQWTCNSQEPKQIFTLRPETVVPQVPETNTFQITNKSRSRLY